MLTTSTRPASSRFDSFARSAVFDAFSARDARRGLDQSEFVDRDPAPPPRRYADAGAGGAQVIDQFSVALRQVDVDDELQP